MNSEKGDEKTQQKSIYNQAFVIGKKILCESNKKLGKEAAKNTLLRVIRELRREMMPERFRFKFTQLLIDVASSLDINISFPKEIKTSESIKLIEFYRLSSLILMGFWDAYSAFSRSPNPDEFCKEEEV